MTEPTRKAKMTKDVKAKGKALPASVHRNVICPFCRSDQLRMDQADEGRDWAVTCVDCYAGGPYRKTKAQAWADWNDQWAIVGIMELHYSINNGLRLRKQGDQWWLFDGGGEGVVGADSLIGLIAKLANDDEPMDFALEQVVNGGM